MVEKLTNPVKYPNRYAWRGVAPLRANSSGINAMNATNPQSKGGNEIEISSPEIIASSQRCLRRELSIYGKVRK